MRRLEAVGVVRFHFWAMDAASDAMCCSDVSDGLSFDTGLFGCGSLLELA